MFGIKEVVDLHASSVGVIYDDADTPVQAFFRKQYDLTKPAQVVFTDQVYRAEDQGRLGCLWLWQRERTRCSRGCSDRV